MASYTTPAHYRSRREPEKDSGVLVKVVALFLGIAVAVLTVAVVVMMQATDEARDEAKAAGQPAATATTEHDHSSHSSSAVSLPLQSFAGTTAENAEELAMAHKATDATLPPIPAGDLVKVQMTLKDMVVEIAPGVKYNTWAFDGHGAPGPVVHVREGQTVEMTLTNGGSIPHSIDFHAARIAPNHRVPRRGARGVVHLPLQGGRSRRLHVPLRDEAGARAHRQRHVRRDHRRAEGRAAARRQRVRPRRQRVVHERPGHRRAGVARHGEGPLEDGRLGHVQRVREPVRHAPADRELRATPRASGSSPPGRRTT